MANRPGYQKQDDLLNLSDDNETPTHSGGQRPPADPRMLHDYDAEAAGAGRISTSHDDFVGSHGAPTHLSTAGMQGGPALSVTSPGGGSAQVQHPFGDPSRNYSQASGVGSYQPYTDHDGDGYSDAGGYYAAGGNIDEDNVPGLPLNSGNKHRSRNSILSLGGGITGRVKHALGMGPDYSEMDLPLTEQGVHRAETDSTTPDQSTPSAKKRKTPGSSFKFGLPGRSKPDPSTLGPRIIHLNNTPANAANKYVDNHVSTTKYNIATFVPKFLYEQFSKYANVFFLFTAILQQIPNISPTNKFTTIVPLGIVSVDICGEGSD